MGREMRHRTKRMHQNGAFIDAMEEAAVGPIGAANDNAGAGPASWFLDAIAQ
jgi:hypothetical protein